MTPARATTDVQTEFDLRSGRERASGQISSRRARLLATLVVAITMVIATFIARGLLGSAPDGASLQDERREAAQAWLKHAQRAERPDAVASLAAALNGDPAGRWQTMDRPVSEGYGPDTLWLRAEFMHEGAPRAFVLELGSPFHDHVQLALRAPDGQIRIWRFGDREAAPSPRLDHRQWAVPLTFDQPGTWTVAVQVRTSGAMYLDVLRWEPEAFEHVTRQEDRWFGVWYGAMAVVAVAAMMGWVATRDARFAAFFAHTVCAAAMFYALNGYLLLSWSGNAGLVDAWTPLSACLTSATSAWLILQLYRRHPALRWPRASWWMQLGLAAATGVAWFFGGYDEFAPWMLGMTIPTALIALLVSVRDCLRRVDDMARWLRFFGLFAAGIGVFPVLLRATGQVSSGVWAAHGYQLGLLLQALCFLGALFAWQVHATRRLALEQAEEIVRSAGDNADLERRVQERTEALRLEMSKREALQRERDALLADTRLALADSQTALQTQKHFTAIVSHEFFTPLASIDMAAQALQLGHGEAASDGQRLNAIRAQVRVLTQLLDDCLLLARVEQSTPERWRAFDWPLELRAVVESEALRHGTLALPVELDLGDAPPRGLGDAGMVRLAVGNLLRNALRASEGTPVRVSLRRDPTDARVVLSVRDHGPGFEQAMLDQPFQPFRRGRTDAGTPGLGLGLYLAARITELHGGRISAFNMPDGGACVTSSWPAG